MNNKYIIPLVILVVIVGGGALALTHKSSSGMNSGSQTTKKSTAQTPATQPNTVIMKDLSFSPTRLTVKQGTTVTWRNEDTASHNIIFNDTSFAGTHTQLLKPGDSYQYTFDKTGTYDYHCEPHPFMKASIDVQV